MIMYIYICIDNVINIFFEKTMWEARLLLRDFIKNVRVYTGSYEVRYEKFLISYN